MRRRAITMTVSAVAVAVLLLGIPGLVFGSIFVWRDAADDLHRDAVTIMNVVDRRMAAGRALPREVVDNAIASSSYPTHVYLVAGNSMIDAGENIRGETISRSATGASGARVTVSVSRAAVIARMSYLAALGTVAIFASFIVGVMFARWQSRKLSAPLIYLAAAAEQIGAGQARPRMKKSGIEEIDLVYEELVRTADRMAGRIAAERQFAADASHQLRTPLTALSMRLEEIEFLSDREDVREEAASCLEQVERLAGVVAELLSTSRSAVSDTEAVPLRKLFEQQRDEWERAFAAEGRELVFDGETGLSVLASPGALAQIVATLVENSLKYGAGVTRVTARKVGKGVVIDIGDEGEGIPDDMVDAVFTKGVSTGGSTGIGLPLAKSLAEAAGGRLELTRPRPPVFRVALAAVPRSLDPDKILPAGAIISMGSRRRRR